MQFLCKNVYLHEKINVKKRQISVSRPHKTFLHQPCSWIGGAKVFLLSQCLPWAAGEGNLNLPFPPPCTGKLGKQRAWAQMLLQHPHCCTAQMAITLKDAYCAWHRLMPPEQRSEGSLKFFVLQSACFSGCSWYNAATHCLLQKADQKEKTLKAQWIYYYFLNQV